MKNATLLFKRDLDANTSVIVTFNQYSNEYQIRLNHSEGIRYQSASSLKDAQNTCRAYLSAAQSLIEA